LSAKVSPIDLGRRSGNFGRVIFHQTLLYALHPWAWDWRFADKTDSGLFHAEVVVDGDLTALRDTQQHTGRYARVSLEQAVFHDRP
jgi:hypothetical protein